jgi:hypothetical protein
VQLAIESLEVGLVLNGGEVLVYRMADHQSTTARQLPDKRLVSLEHVPVSDGLRFKPYFLVAAESSVSAFAISDVGEHASHLYELFPYVFSLGFASVAYTNGSLIVIDMRGPRVILQVGKAQQTTHHHGFLHRNSPSTDPVLGLAWTISGVKSGKSPLLFVLYKDPETPSFCRRHASNSADCCPRHGTRSNLYTCAG